MTGTYIHLVPTVAHIYTDPRKAAFRKRLIDSSANLTQPSSTISALIDLCDCLSSRLSSFFVPFDGAHAMLALATSLSAWIQVILLYLRLKKEEVVYNSNIFNKEPFISIVSCIIMLVILGSILIQPIELAKNEYYIRGLLLGLYIITGGLVYIISMYILGYKFKKSLS